MSKIKAKITFVTGIGHDAAMTELKSNSDKGMISSDVYDCGVYDWLLFNFDFKIPKSSIIQFEVIAKPSFWGEEIDEISYEIINGTLKIKNLDDQLIGE
ncbi:hypothetical protein NVP1154O_38 [Vibrio phage 1.154.O._10N.222.52.B12]|nr:hypothetical protein NVP1154O_38 [Vibrio phage 1.154.O._10N.222.52.B12]